jgi:hypothetical protein
MTKCEFARRERRASDEGNGIIGLRPPRSTVKYVTTDLEINETIEFFFFWLPKMDFSQQRRLSEYHLHLVYNTVIAWNS